MFEVEEWHDQVNYKTFIPTNYFGWIHIHVILEDYFYEFMERELLEEVNLEIFNKDDDVSLGILMMKDEFNLNVSLASIQKLRRLPIMKFRVKLVISVSV